MTPSVRLLAITLPIHDTDYPLEDQLPLEDGLDLIEFAGRWDYGERSIAKMGDPRIIKRWLDSGEESMVEMVDASFLITCSRVVSHELVRHRIASFQQESQRFVAYEEERAADLFYQFTDEIDALVEETFTQAYSGAIQAYRSLRHQGVSKQDARYVLPNATRTRVVAKMNLREWRHVLHLRMHTSAQPEMQEVMRLIWAKLNRVYGDVLFPADIAAERGTR